MIKSTLVTSTDVDVPVTVFTSTVDGDPAGAPEDEVTNAITTMILCNTGTPNISDESVNSETCKVFLVTKGGSASSTTTIVSNLVIPAGETVFFSDEKIILGPGDTVRIGTATGSLISATVSFLQV